MDTRKFRPEAIALLATKTIDSAVRVITQTPVPLKKKYQHWNHKDISTFYQTKPRKPGKIDSPGTQNDHNNESLLDVDNLDMIIWNIYERRSMLLGDSTRVLPIANLKDTIDEIIRVLGSYSQVDVTEAKNIADTCAMQDKITWGSFLKFVKSSLLSNFKHEEDYEGLCSRGDTRVTINHLDKYQTADLIGNDGFAGKGPTASTVQVDDVFYQKDEVHTAVVESVRKEYAEIRRKSQSRATSPRNLDYLSCNTSNEIGSEQVYTPRIRCSLSHNTNERRRSAYHYRNPVQTGVDIHPDKHVPGKELYRLSILVLLKRLLTPLSMQAYFFIVTYHQIMHYR
jgi:hypothetical protein